MYRHNNSGKAFTSLIDARKYAIKYAFDDMAKKGRSKPLKEYIDYYDHGLLDKTKSGMLLFTSDLKVIWYPRYKVDSAFISKNGKSVRKLTKIERDRYM